MITAELGDYFMWSDQVVKVHAINPGSKAICFMVKEPMVCPDCGKIFQIEKEFSVIESSPLFQENAKPIPTLSHSKTRN